MPAAGVGAALTCQARAAVAVTGAGGLIGGVLVPHLARRFAVRALDVRPLPAAPGVVTIRGSVTDGDLLTRLFAQCRFVIHLATGAARGWEGLLEVDIVGTRTVIDRAEAAGVRRVLLASTNHVAGEIELDGARGRPAAGSAPVDAVRPDSPYGAAKAFGEAYARFIAETTVMCVSCLRIGSVRSEPELRDDSPPAEAASPSLVGHWPPELLTPAALARRLRRTWLSHADLIRIVDEELASTERFRFRWAVTDSPERLWPLEVLTWDP